MLMDFPESTDSGGSAASAMTHTLTGNTVVTMGPVCGHYWVGYSRKQDFFLAHSLSTQLSAQHIGNPGAYNAAEGTACLSMLNTLCESS